jgi:hypothetical protein
MANDRYRTDGEFFKEMAALLRNLSPMIKPSDLSLLKFEAELNCGKKKHFQELVMPVLKELTQAIK